MRERSDGMSQWIIPNWNGGHQRGEQLELEENEEGNHNHLLPMPKYEAAELLWENGQRQPAAVKGPSELLTPPSAKPSWPDETDTLESIVRKATFNKPVSANHGHTESPRQEPTAAPLLRKRTWSNPECNELCSDATLMSWAFSESPESLRTNYTDEDLARHDGEEHDAKRKTDGFCSAKRIRAATAHNQSERRRRDRINQRMKDLQKLVPNGSKNDRASLLDDAIRYLKQLQAQIQLMSCMRTMPPMMVPLPLGTHQQLQMALLAGRMGMALGLLDGDSMARSTTQSIARILHPYSAVASHHAFAPPPVLVPQPKSGLSTNAPADPFCTFLAQQSMNMDIYSKMVTLYCQEVNKTPRRTGKSRRVEGEEDML